MSPTESIAPISFPEREIDDVRESLMRSGIICTTRVQHEKGLYIKGRQYMTPWGDVVEAIGVTEGKGLDRHPHQALLDDQMRAEIGDHPFDIVYLRIVTAPQVVARSGEHVLQLCVGDCFDWLKARDPGTIGNAVCDPPYGLEFMGKGWDAPWKYGFTEAGVLGAPLPSFTSSRNPMCRTCHKHKRGSVSHVACTCDEPDFDDVEHKVGDLQKFQRWSEEWLALIYKVLVPGGTAKIFGGTRTFHRIGAAMYRVGFQDLQLDAWVYGSGFPKSMNISKAIDKHLGAVQEPTGEVYVKPDGSSPGQGTNSWTDELGDREYQITAPSTDEAKAWEGWGTALKPAWEPILIGRKP